MSRGLGTHQRRILEALEPRGWVFQVDLPAIGRDDASAYRRAAGTLERRGLIRREQRRRRFHLRPFTLLISVTQGQNDTACLLPKNERFLENIAEYVAARAAQDDQGQSQDNRGRVPQDSGGHRGHTLLSSVSLVPVPVPTSKGHQS